MRVKVCGITNLQDAQLANQLGAWALGFNFYGPSKRFITPKTAYDIAHQLDPKIIKVGVFVNATLQDVLLIYKAVGLDMVQLHGDETPDYCQQLPMPIIKVLRPKYDDAKLDSLKHWQGVEALLIDHYATQSYGGNGQLANWNYAKHAKQFANTILAGGLCAENCQSAINTVKPYAIDICSGVEAYPGKKSPQKLAQLFQSIKQNEKPSYPASQAGSGEMI